MKIFMGTDTPEFSGKIAKRFGHANYYLIYNTENESSEFISNSEHDEKHSILFKAIENGVDTFIVGNIGPHAFEILSENNVKIYLARKSTIAEAIRKLLDNDLELITEPTIKKSMHH